MFGHGTSVASVVGSQYSGVARRTILHSVRVFDCSGASASPETLSAAFTWIRDFILDQRQGPVIYPAVVMFSGFGPADNGSVIIEAAVTSLIYDANVPFVTIAGNGGNDSAYITPARNPWALTVGGTTANDSRHSTSNYGSAIDLFAPGDTILAADPNSYGPKTGTSFAGPHAAGAAALWLEREPTAFWMTVRFGLEDLATPDVVTNEGPNTTRKFLYVPRPAAPTNVELRRVSPTRVDISWRDNATNETGYAVGRRNVGQSVFAPIYSGPLHVGTGVIGIVDDNAPSLNIVGLAPEANFYEYRVEAQGGPFLPAYSGISSTQNLPAAAASVTAQAISSTRVNVSWMDNSTNEAGFKIERRTAGSNDPWVEIVNHPSLPGTGQRNWWDNSVTFGKSYEYRVLAYSGTGHSGYSNTASVTTPNVYVTYQTIDSDLPESGAIEGSERVVLEIVPNLELTEPVTVGYFTWNLSGSGWATADADFGYRAGSLNFPTHSTSGATIDIPVPKVNIIQDSLQEPIEKFELHFNNLIGAIPKPGQELFHMHTFYIVDDDTRASVGNSAATLEGQQFSFPVTLDRAFGREIRVSYQTLDGSGTAGSDYVSTSGVLTFAPGQTSTTVLVTTIDDSLDEYDTETVRLRISPVLNVQVGTSEASGAITDNDPLPTVSITDGSLPESIGAIGFLVQLSAPSGKIVKVNYSTTAGTATAGADYVTTTGTLTFAAAEIQKTATVPLLDDLAVEDVETFTVTLSVPVDVTIPPGGGQAIGRILPDGDVSRISAGDASVTEGDPGPSVNVTVPVTLSALHYLPVSVNYATLPGSASSLDFVATSGTLTIPAGATSGSVTIGVTGDLSDEDPETILLNLSLPTPPTIATTMLDGQGVVTILDNDPPPSISMTEGSAIEGDCGGGSLFSTVSISPPSGKLIGWLFETAELGGESARAYEDYGPVSQSMSIAPGVSTVTLGVPVVSDRVDEASEERLWAKLSNITNGNVTGAQAILRILDDDTAPGLTGDEIAHGTDERRNLPPAGGVNWYAIGERARSSYEVVVEETAGNVASTGSPIRLDLMSCNQGNVNETSRAVGSGNVRSLRWESGAPDYQDRRDRLVRVMSGCTTGCGGKGAYRLRAFETTYSIARFNNSGQQYTLVHLQNPTGYAIDASLHFWDATGSFLATKAYVLAPRASVALDLRTVAGLSDKFGSITVANTGRYGDLTGGAVGIDEGTEMTFDTPMVPRPR
jgi:hypothetical protein